MLSKKTLVTGGAGFIGSHLVDKLLEEGHRVDCYDDYSSGFKQNHHQGCMYYTMDIREPFLTQVKFDVIFHLAAQPRVQPSFNNPSHTFDVNVNGTARILEYATL